MSDEKIPAGFYRGRAIKGSEQYGLSSKGNDEILLRVQVPSLNRSLFVRLSFSDGAAPYSIDKLRACGWTGNDVTKLDGIDANEVDVNIKYEIFENKEQMKVDIYAGGGIKVDTPMDDKQKRSFGARVAALLKGSGKNGPAPKAAPKSDDGDDDAIPF